MDPRTFRQYIRKLRFVPTDKHVDVEIDAAPSTAHLRQPDNFSLFTRIEKNADDEAIREKLESIAVVFALGTFYRRTQYITGEIAYQWIARALKRDLGITALPCRKHKVNRRKLA
jgi:hypothetical protein